MKSLLVAFAVFGAATVQAAQIDPALQNFAQGRGGASARVVLILRSRATGTPSPRRYDYRQTVAYLRALNSQGYTELRSFLGSQPTAPREIRIVSNYWINSTITADVTPAGLRLLAAAPSVSKIYANRWVRNEPDRRGRIVRRPRPDDDLPYQYRQMGLDQLIRTDPGVDGRGVLLGHLDSGVDGAHEALRGKVFKFWDSRTKEIAEPFDTGEHGTHTAGTMVGGDRSSTLIGVAPAARIISVASLTDFDGMLASMQFFLDPDGNPDTRDFPRSINNSWNCEGAPDVEVFYTAVGAWEAAGILPVFSAGNAGPGPGTITKPHEHPATFAVASTSEDGLVSDFSSRGPGNFHGTPTQKPDIAAPGDNIRSSLPGGQYGEMSGTSMATPQVTGSTALLLQIDPSLTPDQLRKVLVESSKKVDANGQPVNTRAWNANYGQGKISIFDAVQLVKRIKIRRFQKDSGMLPAFAGLFTEPADLAADAVLREEPVSVDELIRFPQGLTDKEWLTPAQVWGS